ncbi:uncharacterized protein V6R79_018868 [Siganus canaliculatus]
MTAALTSHLGNYVKVKLCVTLRNESRGEKREPSIDYVCVFAAPVSAEDQDDGV